MRTLLLLSICTWLLPASAHAQWGVDWDDEASWHVALTGSRVRQSLEGDFALGGALGATPLDVDGILDMGDSDDFAGRVDVRLPAGGHLRLGYRPLSFEGMSDLTTTVVVFGVPFAIGDRVASAVDLQSFALGYRHDLNFGPWLTISPLVDVEVFDGNAEVQNLSVAGTLFEEDLLQPVPLVGARIEVRPLPRAALFAEARGIRIGSLGEIDDVSMIAGEAGVRFLVTKNMAVVGRYRLDDIDFTASDVDVDLRLETVSLDLELRF